jgi:hypothetical protein
MSPNLAGQRTWIFERNLHLSVRFGSPLENSRVESSKWANKEHPSEFFQFTFSREASSVDGQMSYPRGIRIDVPVKFSHRTIDVPREWATHTDLDRDREDMLTHGCDRPRSNGNGFCIRKRRSCPSSTALSRGDPIL